MKFPVFFFILSCIISSCTDGGKQLARAWIYHDWTVKEQSGYYERFKRTPAIAFTSGNFIDLQRDSSYHSYLEEYSVGTWRFEKDTLLMKDARSQAVRRFRVLEKNKDQLFLTHDEKDKIYVFDGFRNRFDSLSQNPFSLLNNHWRVKADHKENDSELLNRLHNHFRFWEMYFAWALKEDIKSLPVRGVPSLLKMYGNGFQLEYFEYQPPEWKKLFYDTADSRKVFVRMHYLMYDEDIKWPETENRFKGFISAFRQMQSWGKSEAGSH